MINAVESDQDASKQPLQKVPRDQLGSLDAKSIYLWLKFVPHNLKFMQSDYLMWVICCKKVLWNWKLKKEQAIVYIFTLAIDYVCKLSKKPNFMILAIDVVHIIIFLHKP